VNGHGIEHIIKIVLQNESHPAAGKIIFMVAG
jgi:hypothetical protein